MQALLTSMRDKGRSGFQSAWDTILNSQLLVGFRLHLIYIVMVSFYVIAVFYASSQTGQTLAVTEFLGNVLVQAAMFSILVFFWVLSVQLYHRVWLTKDDVPIRFLFGEMLAYTRQKFTTFFPIIMIIIVFVECFSFFKSSIPVLNPFAYDLVLMELDKTLHFGIDPWRLLQPFLGYWPVTFALNFVYNLWFIVLWSVFMGMAFSSQHNRLRMQFLIAFLLSWSIGGSLIATLLSSAGPGFFEQMKFTAENYVPLMDYLKSANEIAPIFALDAQHILWDNYMHNNEIPIASISAMPSMHNTTSFLIAILAWQYNRKAGIIASLFALCIFLGSIHLAWHYALDAYIGFIVAGFSWWIGGKITDWYMGLPSVQNDLKKFTA